MIASRAIRVTLLERGGLGEVDERLVDPEDDARPVAPLGQRLEQRRRQQRARRVAGVGQQHQVQPVQAPDDRVERGRPPFAGRRDQPHDPAAERLEGGLVLAEGGVHDERPARRDRPREQVDQLGRAVARDDVAGRHPVVTGERLREPGRARVGVAGHRREGRKDRVGHARR